jgi:hypothetical protein
MFGKFMSYGASPISWAGFSHFGHYAQYRNMVSIRHGDSLPCSLSWTEGMGFSLAATVMPPYSLR